MAWLDNLQVARQAARWTMSVGLWKRCLDSERGTLQAERRASARQILIQMCGGACRVRQCGGARRET
eukprot:2983163-Pyramimonas_sp.AAC.1